MATIGLWPVKCRLKDVLDYADNPDKTTAQKYLNRDLYATLTYAGNDEKTDQQIYVDAINCPKQRAYQAMMAVIHKVPIRKAFAHLSFRKTVPNMRRKEPKL